MRKKEYIEKDVIERIQTLEISGFFLFERISGYLVYQLKDFISLLAFEEHREFLILSNCYSIV